MKLQENSRKTGKFKKNRYAKVQRCSLLAQEVQFFLTKTDFQRNTLSDFFGRIWKLGILFGLREKNCGFLAEVPKNDLSPRLQTDIFSQKTILKTSENWIFFSDFKRKIFGSCSRNWFLRGKMNIFGKENRKNNTHKFPIFFRFWAKDFGKVVKTAFFLSRGTIWEKF